MNELVQASSAPAYPPIGKKTRDWRGYGWTNSGPQWLIHVGAFYGLWVCASWQVWTLCFALYVARMFAVTGFYHRYFSHRTYKTSRWMQFLMAVAAMSSSQRGV